MRKCIWLVLLGVMVLAEPATAARKVPIIIPPPHVNPVLYQIIQRLWLRRLLTLEQTLYEGAIWYFPVLKKYPTGNRKPMRVFWWGRAGGLVASDDAYFFPNLWTNNADIAALMADIGVPTTRTHSSAEMWSRMGWIWYWMSSHTSGDGESYSTGPGFPSIADMAWSYRQNGVIHHGSCMGTAQLMATLMARAGIPVNRIALGHAHYGDEPSHVFVLLLMEEGWYYLDPTYCHSHDQLPEYEDRASFGWHQTCDYTHPFEVNILPRSDLNSVPLCLDAE